DVEVEKADKVPGKTIVKVASADGSMEETYTIHFEVEDELYLSDLDWESATTGWGTIHRDKSVEGNTLTLASDGEPVTYDKGIGTHARSEIVYDIADKGYDTFQADVGLDQEANQVGSVVFQVWADDDKLYESDVMRKDTPAETID